MTYLGFRGPGLPTEALWQRVRERFPDAILVELADGRLGVVVARPHDMSMRKLHEEAAAGTGWTGDVVDFPRVARDCTMTFTHPVPVPPPKP